MSLKLDNGKPRQNATKIITFFGWMHGKLTGKREIKKDYPVASNKRNIRQDLQTEEFSDWPQGLLTIGTFGINNLKQEADKSCRGGIQPTSDDHLQDVTPEEVTEIQKKLALLLDKQQVEHLLNTQNPQSGNLFKDDDKNGNNRDDIIGRLERCTSLVLGREKDICADQTKGSIRKKLLSFIIKKIFVCQGGFAPTPSLRDINPEKSRMEKILRAILRKKIYPQNSSPKATAKKYLETNALHDSESDDEMFDVKNDGSKWVKTDSDYIVLEI